MASVLQQHLARQRQGVVAGIYSVCSAHPWVIRAAAEQAAEDGSLLLVEATSNQVNQYLPAQYLRLRRGMISEDPVALIVDKVRDVLRMYAAACVER